MKKFMLLTVVVGALFVSACSQSPFYHEHIMRGHVLNVNDQEARVCIGEKDGAKINDELEVFRVVVTGEDDSGLEVYDREPVGKVKITRITGDHFAVASIIEGKVGKHDIVELSR